jgi:serine/threonine-protein kinase
MAKSIGRYEIREELGRGGMAAVYLAYDPQLGRQVALKLMDQQLSGDPAVAARFEREAKTVAALEHGAIVSLYDYGEADGWLYLVMRYMKGGSLKEQIARGPLALEMAYNVVHRIGSALDKAHRMDVIHRDLKPGNILLDEEGESYLSDFGIVKVAKGDAEYLTETGQTLGTFAYMSPEQVLGGELDGRSDVYSLGVVLYEMLTGVHPYSQVATTSGAMAVAHTQQPIPDITEDNSALPSALIAVIQRALAKDPSDRYKTGAEMAAAMQAALTSSAATTAATATTAAAAAAKTDKQALPAQPVRQQPKREQLATGAVVQTPVTRPAGDEKRKTPGWVIPVAAVAVIVCIGIAAVAGYLAFGTEPTDDGPEQTRIAAELALAANQTQVAAVETQLAGQSEAEQTRMVADLTQEAVSIRQAEIELTQEVELTRVADLTRMAATQTQEAELTQQAELTRIASESTQIAEAAPVTVSFQQGVSPDGSYDGVSDATLSEIDFNINFGDTTECLVDGDDPPGSDNDLVSLLNWDIREIPAGSRVTRAIITLLVTNNTPATYQIYELKRPWVEDEATWFEASRNDAWQEPGANGARDRVQTWISTLAPLEVGRIEVDLDDAALAVIQDWINGPSSNYGFIIANSAATDGFDFVCSESTNSMGRPTLTITYEPGG